MFYFILFSLFRPDRSRESWKKYQKSSFLSWPPPLDKSSRFERTSLWICHMNLVTERVSWGGNPNANLHSVQNNQFFGAYIAGNRSIGHDLDVEKTRAKTIWGSWRNHLPMTNSELFSKYFPHIAYRENQWEMMGICHWSKVSLWLTNSFCSSFFLRRDLDLYFNFQQYKRPKNDYSARCASLSSGSPTSGN